MSNAHWNGNKLMVNWYGESEASEVGELCPNTNKRKYQPFVFIADTIDDQFILYLYEKPSAETLFYHFLQWQNERDRVERW